MANLFKVMPRSSKVKLPKWMNVHETWQIYINKYGNFFQGQTKVKLPKSDKCS